MSVEYQKADKPNTKWTVDIMAGAIYALKEYEEPINFGYLRIHHPRLSQAIANHPGGWNKIVEFAGFNPEEERKNKPISGKKESI